MFLSGRRELTRRADRRFPRHGQLHDQLGTPTGPLAAGLDPAAVQLDQPASQRQANAHAALITVQRVLGEQLEQVR